jgi:hypothetical protein
MVSSNLQYALQRQLNYTAAVEPFVKSIAFCIACRPVITNTWRAKIYSPQAQHLHARGSAMAPPALQKQYMSSGTKPKQGSGVPRPSARCEEHLSPHQPLLTFCSILLISPTNEILLLHRVRTSSSFPSAHVFPGGNLEASQDGDIPSVSHPQRHLDGSAYRTGAIRECFEESGILLAKRNDGSGQLLEIPDEEREKARKGIHSGSVKFVDWVKSQGGVVDTGMSVQSLGIKY